MNHINASMIPFTMLYKPHEDYEGFQEIEAHFNPDGFTLIYQHPDMDAVVVRHYGTVFFLKEQLSTVLSYVKMTNRVDRLLEKKND